ncbi:MAG: autotransporter outer membrane beta-barrel domain-containing protein [Methylobacillus sp.]|nr:autotransporter outer membrane beta-barrel domain-containing protein [Methylobacillus sp.]
MPTDPCINPISWAAGANGTAGTAGSANGSSNRTGGSGGQVTVHNTGSILTVGSRSDAITALSVGGVSGLGSYTAQDLFWTGLPTGAQSGGAGNVVASNTALLMTEGNQSSGIMALSLASGFGAGDVTTTNTGTIVTHGSASHAMAARSQVYAMGSGNAAAGDISASNIGGTILTDGSSAAGIIAESISAMGTSGDVTVDSTNGVIQLTGSGNASAISALSQADDDAGNVSISNVSGRITSFTGGNASAIRARSISATGNAGNIRLDNRGGEIVSDNTGIAIHLSSQANSGTAGNIEVLNHSAIISTAPGSIALTLESLGFTGGNILFENGGLVEGGAGGTAISLVGGNNNRIVNDNSLDPADTAIIRTGGSIFDTVIKGTTGNDRIENLNGAMIFGSVDLGAGTNAFHNGAGSYYHTGSQVNLGAGNLFTNDGYFSPGGLGTVMSNLSGNGPVTLTGDFVQSATGHLLFDINFATSAAALDFTDLLHVTGTVSLDGQVTLNPVTAGAGKPGFNQIPLVVSGAGAITDNGITLNPYFYNGNPSTTVAFKPTLTFIGDTLFLTYNVEYSQNFATPNASSYINNLINPAQIAGAPAYQPVIDAVISIWDPVAYQRAVDSITGEGTVASQQAIASSRAGFANSIFNESSALLDCDSNPITATRQECEKEERSWIRMNRRVMDISGNPNTASTWSSDSGAAAGYDRRVGEHTVVGAALGFSHLNYNVSDRWTSGRANGINIGVHGMVKSDAGLYGKALLMAGYFENDHSRYAIGRRVTGDHKTSAFGGAIEFGFKSYLNSLSINPFMAVQYDSIRQRGYAEDDPTWGNRYESESVYSLPISAGLRIEGSVVNGFGLMVKPNLKYTYIHEAKGDRGITLSPNPAPAYRARIDGVSAPDNVQQFEMGLKAQLSNTIEFNLNIVKEWASGTNATLGALGMSYFF